MQPKLPTNFLLFQPVLQWVPAIKKAEILDEASVSYRVSQHFELELSFLADTLPQQPSDSSGGGRRGGRTTPHTYHSHNVIGSGHTLIEPRSKTLSCHYSHKSHVLLCVSTRKSARSTIENACLVL